MKSTVKKKHEFLFKQGELYISTDTDTIVICNVSTPATSFRGTCLVKGDDGDMNYPWIVGEICDTCFGPKFIPFKGTVELVGE